jgi:DtxR family Mn-dependent transcriptional regulator
VDSGYHTPLEEYLETIQTLRDEGSEVIGARVAERLGRSAPAVKEMLDRLEDDGYLARQGRVILLTERGEDVATTVVRRHRLAERLLVDVIGLEWHKVHAEAGRWEHVISADVEEKLVALLGDPGTCPHGNPIPGSRHLVDVAERELGSVTKGETVVLHRIGEAAEHDHDTLVALDEAGFIPGSEAVVVATTTSGEIVLDATNGVLEIDAAMATSLYVVDPAGGGA